MMIMIPIPGDSVRTSDKGAPVVYLYFLGVMSHLSVLGQSGPGFSGLTFTAVFVQWRSAIDRPFGPFDLRQPSLPLLDRRVRPSKEWSKGDKKTSAVGSYVAKMVSGSLGAGLGFRSSDRSLVT